MPQMSPLSWLTLMMTFVLIMIMFNFLNYYVFNYSLPKNNKVLKKSHSINWKW